MTGRQDQLLEPPRLAFFCPAIHCSRACSLDCTCKPCRCPRHRPLLRPLTSDHVPARVLAPQLGLFPTLTTSKES